MIKTMIQNVLPILFVSMILSCKSYKITNQSVNNDHSNTLFKQVKFCNLVNVPSGEFVELEVYYSGVDEYWSLTSNSNCDMDNKVYLDTDNISNTSLKRRFRHLHNNYWKYSLKLSIKGQLEKTDQDLGYGHLGLLKTQLIPIRIKIIEKKPLY